MIYENRFYDDYEHYDASYDDYELVLVNKKNYIST